jgi:excisionase family DNA binding protein
MTKASSRLPSMLSVEQVALQVGVSIKTVRRWINRREVHCHRLGRTIRVSEDDLIAFLNRHRD